jgi:hypothetical protein
VGIGTGELNGEGIVLVGPFGDEGPQWSIGGEDPMVSVAVDSGWGEDRGEAVQELEGRETEGGPAGQVRPWEQVEDLVGAAIDEVEVVESEGGPGTIPDQSFEARAVGGLNPDAPVHTEPSAVIPVEHILGLVGLQEAVASEVAEHSLSDGVLEVHPELGGEGGGFVETEADFRIGGALIGAILDPLEEPVYNTQMEMVVRVQRRAEAMQEADGAHGGGLWSRWTGLPQGGVEGPEENMQHGAGGAGPVMEEGPETFGHGKDPLADGHMGNDVVHQVSRGLGHALGVA